MALSHAQLQTAAYLALQVYQQPADWLVQVDRCRSFHSVQAFHAWLREKGLDVNCNQWKVP
jgi:hypothetical protein